MKVSTFFGKNTGRVEFSHLDNFQGDVEIMRGEKSVTVPMEYLRGLVVEAVRRERIEAIQAAKPAELLK